MGIDYSWFLVHRVSGTQSTVLQLVNEWKTKLFLDDGIFQSSGMFLHSTHQIAMPCHISVPEKRMHILQLKCSIMVFNAGSLLNVCFLFYFFSLSNTHEITISNNLVSLLLPKR